MYSVSSSFCATETNDLNNPTSAALSRRSSLGLKESFDPAIVC